MTHSKLVTEMLEDDLQIRQPVFESQSRLRKSWGSSQLPSCISLHNSVRNLVQLELFTGRWRGLRRGRPLKQLNHISLKASVLRPPLKILNQQQSVNNQIY